MKLPSYCYKFTISCFLIIILCHLKIWGQQSYGLGFYSHEVVADQRTSLDLFPGQGFTPTQNFRLSFEISFLPDQIDYFGYIFRIIENSNRNIDLIYNKRDMVEDGPDTDHNHFKLVVDDRFTKIGFDIPQKRLLSQWSKVVLEFDIDHDQLLLNVNGHTYVEPNAHLNKKDIYKLCFGINNYPNFKTTDAPPFKLRDIRIDVGGEPRFHWPLNEAQGYIAHDILNNQQGIINHPLWIRAQHHNWAQIRTVKAQGMASMAFNPLTAEVYVIGSDSLWSISVKNGKQTAAAYANGRFNLKPSNESVYNIYDHRLYNYYIDRKNATVATYNFNTHIWNRDEPYFPIIDYWHANNFFSVADTSLYVVAGYGQLTYKNNVHRYHIPTGKWAEVNTGGDSFCPRYLAACGVTDSGRYAYFLGGYGSLSGQQMLNPKNIYDLVKYDVKAKTFKKIYTLKTPDEDFALANSMIIDEKAQTYTALAFSNHKYNTYLQLMIGSLNQPSYHTISSKIPFSFFDTHAFANLYYSPLTQQFVALTLARSMDNVSTVSVFTLSSPPDAQPLAIVLPTNKSGIKYYIAGFLSIIIAVAGFVYYKRRKSILQPEISDTTGKVNSEEYLAPTKLLQEITATGITTPPQRTILLFGDLKLYTLKGDDITGQFTSLIKELFLVILIYSLRSGRGISPEKLIELLWFDKSENSAKNNRSANLSKLRSLLTQMEYVHLSKETGNWKIEIDFNEVYVDYYNYLQLMANRKPINEEKITALIEITQRGGFLPSADYPWLDQIKSDLSNEIIDILLQYASQINLENDPEMQIKLANCIFNFDLVNEEAMTMKCKALSFLGKHSLAKSTFQAFNKEYLALYGEEFKKDFHSIVT
ncbi:galactose oxidase [Mucilaginibacter sp. 22184]|uniref:galactose oxidase n=1 Tax=Mucilaginibacter sp. 22184 TaxID=3453887 RepID=UPI003F86CB9C